MAAISILYRNTLHWIRNLGGWVTWAAIGILYRNTKAAIGILYRNTFHRIRNWGGATLRYHRNILMEYFGSHRNTLQEYLAVTWTATLWYHRNTLQEYLGSHRNTLQENFLLDLQLGVEGNPLVPYKYFIGILRQPQEYSIGIPATVSVTSGSGNSLVIL